ncbi:Cas10/Cmr2 second palm domain-containing protein [Paraferrimonas haliotis]|uniref:Cas10/Cmr2 second palm domain-containing protein n=1 Tax=Paraferrimonas haliotis TaxID=2013866 RepID=UPI000F78080D|nr:hypothetical protein [Paraferrimonas haliotis]
MTSNNELLLYLEELLNASSTSVPIAQLTCFERYELFLNMLRGNVPFRGGQIRDFPMSRYRFVAGRLFEHLANTSAKEINRNGVKFEVSLASYINAFFIVEKVNREKILSSSIDDLNRYYSFLLLNTSKLLFPKDKISVRHIAMLLGVSNSEFNRFYDKSASGPVRDIYKYTEHLLVISNHNFKTDNAVKEIMHVYGINGKHIDYFKSNKFKVISVKTKNVQRYLDRCKSLFILRGASYWCSQVMSIVRDIVLQTDQKSSVLVDSDSIILILSTDNVQRDILDEVKMMLIGDEGKRIILNKFPRMAPYIDNFVAGVFPNIGIVEFNDVSLFDIVTDKGLVREDRETFDNKIEFPYYLGKHPCSLIRGKYCCELGFIPDWYTKRSRGDSFSFDAALFSLCEISFNQQCIVESKHQLELNGVCNINYSQYSSRVTKELGIEREISYIKYDGDDIGKMFTSIASIERPVLSFSLETKIKQSLIDALVQLEEKIGQNHLVHDLIYSGGDDLFISLPTEYESQFIAAMNYSLYTHLPEIKFTCAVIRVNQDNSTQEDLLHSLVSILSNDLLLYSKSKFKKSSNYTPKQARLYDKYGEIFELSNSKGVFLNTIDLSVMEVNDLHSFYFK